MTQRSDEPAVGEPAASVAVTVTRSGGIAGLRREWTARPEKDDVPRWIALIEGCPWDAAGGEDEVGDDDGPRGPGQPGGDRFEWRIRASCGPDTRDVRLPDRHLQGPWRTLVDEVRDAAPPQHRKSSTARRGP